MLNWLNETEIYLQIYLKIRKSHFYIHYKRKLFIAELWCNCGISESSWMLYVVHIEIQRFNARNFTLFKRRFAIRKYRFRKISKSWDFRTITISVDSFWVAFWCWIWILWQKLCTIPVRRFIFSEDIKSVNLINWKFNK